MSSARYVGRVGALAVALGIGAVVAGVPGVAWAGPEGEPEPSDPPGVSAQENPDGSTGDVSDTDVGGGDLGDPGDTGGVGDGGDVEGGGDFAGGMQVGSSGVVITSTNPGSAGAKSEEKDRDADPPKKRSTVKQKALSVAPSLTQTTTQSTATTVADAGRKARPQAPTLSVDPPKDPGPQLKPSTGSPVDVAPVTLAAPGLQKPVAARMTAVTKPLAQSPVLGLLPFVTLAPTADGKQPGTTDSPLLLGFLLAGRQVDKKASIEDESLARTVDSTETSLMMANSQTGVQAKAAASPTKRDTTAPTVSWIGPADGATVSGPVTLSATATDTVAMGGVQFLVNGTSEGAEDITAGTFPDPSNGYSVVWNTATVANGSYTLTARARDAANNFTTSSTRTVTVNNPDTTAPTVSLIGPAEGATVSGTAVPLSAAASDNVGVTGVQFFVDGSQVGAVDPSSPYSVSWNTATVANGTHTLTARAHDAAGNFTTSAEVRVTVANDTTPPAVSVTAPAGTVSGTVTLNATASDNVAVAGVLFFVDGSPLGAEDTTPSPFSVSWDTRAVSNGTHTLTARARDAAGNFTTSAEVPVTVANDTTPPAVSLTAPAGTVSGTVTLNATASDNVAVAGVQFFVDGAPLGAEDTVAPYGPVLWNTATVADGPHTLTARARDTSGNFTTSTAVPVTVANDTTPPAVSVTAPAGTVSGTVTLNATASDNGGVAGVQFFVDGSPLGAEDPSSPYSVSFNTTWVANGAHTLTARARDTSGNFTTSAAVTVTVANAAPSPAPLSGSTTSINAGLDPNGVAVVGNRAYVANGPSDTVSVIDVNTQQILATIPVDHTPTYVVAKPDGTRVYVSNANSATVSVIDTATNRVIKSVGVYGGAYAQIPGGLAISPDGTKLYVSTVDGTVSLIDTTTNTWSGLKFIRPGITNMEVSADGQRLYIADTQRGVILAVDTAKLVGPTSGVPGIPEIGVGYGTTPVDVAVSRDGKWLYSVNAVGGSHSSVSVIDADPTSATYNRVVRNITVDDTAAFVALSPDGSRLYVTHQVPGKVTVIDTKLNLVLGTVPTDNDPVASDAYIAVGADGRLYITDSDDNRLHITTVSGGILPTVPVSVTPISIGTSPIGVAVSGNQAYVYGNGTVSVINTTTQMTGTTAVYSDPSTATSPDGTRRYQVNGRLVSVIDTATNAVITTVEIPACNDCYYWPGGLYGVEVNPSGTRVYVRENYVTETGGTTVVSVIDTATNRLIGTGYPPLLNDMDATPDGRLYAADMSIPAVYVYDENMNGIASILVLPGTWYAFVDTLAVNADGTRTYAVVSSWDVGFYHVSVIDSDRRSSTYNTEVARIRQQDTAVSPDGSRTYVLGSDGRSVAVIDTATNNLIGTFTTDLTSGSTTRSIAVGPDGTVYVTDAADGTVYVVTIGPTGQQL